MPVMRIESPFLQLAAFFKSTSFAEGMSTSAILLDSPLFDKKSFWQGERKAHDKYKPR